MAGFLFSEIVFGPIISRRFGISLGVNVLPINAKWCNYECVYCECGWTGENQGDVILPLREDIAKALETRLKQMKADNKNIDTITFAGNGEPTMHPNFAEIVSDTIRLRDSYFPKTLITILSNATLIQKPSVRNALMQVDNNVLKLDAGDIDLLRRINLPNQPIDMDVLVLQLQEFHGRVIIQTLFLKGMVGNTYIDNTTAEQVQLWLEKIQLIQPKEVMIYSLDRATPAEQLEKIDSTTLHKIGEMVNALGIMARVYD